MAAVVPNRPKNQFNLLSQARRQTGSTFKTFVLTAAVEMGINPDSTFYVSAPFTYKVHPAGNCDDGSWWCVHTYANDYYGWSSIRSATIRSDNAVYAQLTLDVTAERVAEVARRMGVRSPLDVNGAYVPAIGLGSIAVSPLDIASGYATLAAGGVYAEPMAIRRVVLAERPRRHHSGWGVPKRQPRDLRRNGGGRDPHPRAERPVRHRYACGVRTPGGRQDRDERGARRRLVRRATRRISRPRSGSATRRARSRWRTSTGSPSAAAASRPRSGASSWSRRSRGPSRTPFPEPAVWPRVEAVHERPSTP